MIPWNIPSSNQRVPLVRFHKSISEGPLQVVLVESLIQFGGNYFYQPPSYFGSFLVRLLRSINIVTLVAADETENKLAYDQMWLLFLIEEFQARFC